MPSSVRQVAEVIGADPWKVSSTGKTDCRTENHDSVVGLQTHSHHTYRRGHEEDRTNEMESFCHGNQPKEGMGMSSLDALAMACAAEQSAISYVSPKSIMEEPTKLVPEKQQEMAPPFPSNKNADSDCSNHQVLTSAPACRGEDGNRNLNILVASATAAIETEGVASNIAKEIVVSETKSIDDDGIPKSLASNLSKISRNDVLCGRGGLTNHHPGNIFFRQLVRQRQEMYLRASKRDKASVAKSIVETIRNLDPPGRFLKKKADSSEEGVWCEIGNRKAREKTSQALRERAPELREGLFNNDSQSQQPNQGKNLQKSDQQKHRKATRDKPGQEPNRLLIKRRAYALPLDGNASLETRQSSKAISHDVPGVVSRETSSSESISCSNLMVGNRNETSSFKAKIHRDDHLDAGVHHGVLFGHGNDHFKRQKTYHSTSTGPNVIPIPVSPPSSVCNSSVASSIVHAISTVEEDIQNVGFSSKSGILNQDGTKHVSEDSKRGPRLKMLKARVQNVSEYD